ncbi:MAG: hypothetical protein PHQ57_00525 [Candidatus Omnitrophica bacterium]|nr:hypothetical protein [Candidatus Omnitrophota bacterium]
MKKIIMASLILVILFASNSYSKENKDNAEWFPFVIPEKLDPASPANIGKLVLDPPAGKHGFCKVKNGHFYFEDGTRAKFWGTNLCFSACFPDKKYAEMIAERLAFFGFNAVRLHHMDSNFEPEGIFKDIYPNETNPQRKKTGILSTEQLDKLDYLIYLLKVRGIYIDMNLLVSRQFTEADGIADAKKLNMAAKPVSMFDSKLIALQKKYAKDLLTHYNPYTKLRYCDDPAVALVEITNENSMFILDEETIPPYYSKQLEDKWNNWPKNQYKTTKETKKEFYINIEKRYFQEMIDFLKKSCLVKVPITGIGGYWYPEDIETQELCDYIDTHTYWDHPSFPDKQWDENNFRIHNKSLLLDNNLGIIGKIKNARPTKTPYTITEWNHCYPNKYAYETPLLIASEALKHDWDGLFQFDFTSSIYTSTMLDSIDNYFDIITNPQQLILASFGSIVFLKMQNIETNIKNGILTLESPTLQGSIGFIKDKTMRISDLTIKSDKDGAVLLYSMDAQSIKKSNSLILVTLGEVRNSASGWKKEKFEWGNMPTLLEKMNTKVIFIKNRGLKAHELKPSGSKGRIISGTKTFYFSTQNLNTPWFEIVK